ILADAVAQLAIGAGDAELLDPGMLIGRHGLARELAAEPVEFLGENDGAAGAQGAESRGDATEAATDDEKISGKFFGHLVFLVLEEGAPRVSPSSGSQWRRSCSTGASCSTRRTSISVAARAMASRGMAKEVKRRPGSAVLM